MKMHKRDRSPELAAALMRCAESDIRMAAECEFLTLELIAGRLVNLLCRLKEIEEGNPPEEIENPYKPSQDELGEP